MNSFVLESFIGDLSLLIHVCYDGLKLSLTTYQLNAKSFIISVEVRFQRFVFKTYFKHVN